MSYRFVLQLGHDEPYEQRLRFDVRFDMYVIQPSRYYYLFKWPISNESAYFRCHRKRVSVHLTAMRRNKAMCQDDLYREPYGNNSVSSTFTRLAKDVRADDISNLPFISDSTGSIQNGCVPTGRLQAVI